MELREKVKKLGAFFGMLWQIFFSEKFLGKLDQINYRKLQDVMDLEDKTSFIDNFVQLINQGFKAIITERIDSIWKSIFSDGIKPLKLMERNQEKGFLLGNEAEFMTKSKSFKTSAKSTQVDFAMKSLKDFGFTGSTFKEAQDFFRNHSMYELCMPEDIFYLRISYSDQPKGQWVRLMMDTIPGSSGSPRVFGLGHDDLGLWVSGYWYDPTFSVNPDDLWVVRIRK